MAGFIICPVFFFLLAYFVHDFRQLLSGYIVIFFLFPHENLCYSETCVRKPPLRLTLVVDLERWQSYKGTCHVILLAKLHDIYIYKTDVFFIYPLFKVSLKSGCLTQASLYSNPLSCLTGHIPVF